MARRIKYPETIQELYPEDTRWGTGYLRPPRRGVMAAAYLAELDQEQAHARETIRFFEEKYPDFKWWESNFVDERPAVSLLMQSVNPRLAFQSIASLQQLFKIVEEKSGKEESVQVRDTEYDDVYAARLAQQVLGATPEGVEMLEEAKDHMTENDKSKLWQLEFGIGGEVTNPDGTLEAE